MGQLTMMLASLTKHEKQTTMETQKKEEPEKKKQQEKMREERNDMESFKSKIC
jgi:hypothetical protein